MSVSQSVSRSATLELSKFSVSRTWFSALQSCMFVSVTSQSSFGSQKITPPHSPRGRPRIKMQHIMNCAALSVALVSSQWSVLGWCLSICTEQTDEQDFKLEGKGDWKDGDWQRVCAVALLQLSIDCELVEPRRRQPGIKGREMAERGAVDGGSHQSLLGVAEQDIEGQVNQQRREASMYVWLTGCPARYRSLSVQTRDDDDDDAADRSQWMEKRCSTRSSRSEWMGMMVLDSWTGGGCSSCVTYKCDSECHCM